MYIQCMTGLQGPPLPNFRECVTYGKSQNIVNDLVGDFWLNHLNKL